MRRREFIITLGGAAATAALPLAIATSTSVLAATPTGQSLSRWRRLRREGRITSWRAVTQTDGEADSGQPSPTQGRPNIVLDSGTAQLVRYDGNRPAGLERHRRLTSGSTRNMRRCLMYDTPFQALVLQRSGIATLAPDKKRIGAGPKGYRRHLHASNTKGSRISANRSMDQSTIWS